jgi:hypothetical protein
MNTPRKCAVSNIKAVKRNLIIGLGYAVPSGAGLFSLL